MDLINIEIGMELKGLTLIFAKIIGMNSILNFYQFYLNNKHTLFSELVLMKLNCVRESHYV